MTAGGVGHKSMCACFIDGLLLRDNSYHGSGRIRTHGMHNKRA